MSIIIDADGNEYPRPDGCACPDGQWFGQPFGVCAAFVVADQTEDRCAECDHCAACHNNREQSK